MLYTINSDRSRFQILCDYAAAHDLSAKQIEELVKQLPDYGLKSQLHGSLLITRPKAELISLAQERAIRARKRA
jgi:collagenase-like PrtC family protease